MGYFYFFFLSRAISDNHDDRIERTNKKSRFFTKTFRIDYYSNEIAGQQRRAVIAVDSRSRLTESTPVARIKKKRKEVKKREREKERLYKVGAGTGGSSVVDRHVTNFQVAHRSFAIV